MALPFRLLGLWHVVFMMGMEAAQQTTLTICPFMTTIALRRLPLFGGTLPISHYTLTFPTKPHMPTSKECRPNGAIGQAK